MSHIVTIQTRIRDVQALRQACEKLKLEQPTLGKTRLYLTEAEGWQVHLSGWHYPVVVHPETGELFYDNYGGHWGDIARLHQLLQIYAVEKTRIEARRKGQRLIEQPLEDGSIRLTLQSYSGGAA